MRLRKRYLDFDPFGLPDHTAADFFCRMWRTHESVRHEESRDEELEQVAERFRFKGREVVCDFLRRHRVLIPVLIQAKEQIDSYFGASEHTCHKLEIFTDPEDNESTPKLFALIRTSLPFSDASQRLERFHEEWWFDQSDETVRLLNIGVEYVNAPV